MFCAKYRAHFQKIVFSRHYLNWNINLTQIPFKPNISNKLHKRASLSRKWCLRWFESEASLQKSYHVLFISKKSSSKIIAKLTEGLNSVLPENAQTHLAFLIDIRMPYLCIAWNFRWLAIKRKKSLFHILIRNY